MFKNLLPGWADPTIRYFYLSEAAINLWFIAAVWYFTFRHYVSVSEIGILEIIVFIVGFLAEVPSGALADTIGRRKTLIFGGIMLVIGSIFTAFSNNLLTLIIGQSLWFIGYASYSGANDALVYDNLKAEKKEKMWAEITARKNSLIVFVTMFSVLIGGFLYNIQYRLPFIVYIFANLLFLFFVWKYPKEKFVATKKMVHSFTSYKKTLSVGTKELLRPQLRFLLWGVLLFASLNYAYEWGVLRPMILDNHGYQGFSASLLSFIVHIVMFVVFIYLPRIFGEKASEKQVLFGVLLAAISFILLSFNSTIWFVGMLVIIFTIAASIINWWISIYINEHVSSAHRATALSTWAMLQKVPYILLVGVVTNISQPVFSLFILISGVLVSLSAVGTLLFLKKIDSE